MFRTRKSLLKEISHLNWELSNMKEFHAVASSKNLPKCESIACAGCVHAVFMTTWGGQTHLIGCGKSTSCKDYKPITVPTEKRCELIREDLLLR